MYVISGLCVPGLRVFYDLFKFLLSSRKERSADCSAPFAAGPAGLILGMGLNHMVIAAGSCGRFFCIDQSMRRYCAVVATPLSAPCWQRVQTWSGRGVSECFLMLVCRILCGIQPLLQFLCGRCRVRSFRSANEWHRFPVRIPSGRS